MKYTVRFAHLREPPKWKPGDIIKRGDVIGIMGNTGECYSDSGGSGAHLHIDVVVGEVRTPFKLADIGKKYAPSQKQLSYFIDSELFGGRCFITTQFDDPVYEVKKKKKHPAIDVIPMDKDKTEIHWNRSKNGTVALVLNQPESYGNCIYVTFDA